MIFTSEGVCPPSSFQLMVQFSFQAGNFMLGSHADILEDIHHYSESLLQKHNWAVLYSGVSVVHGAVATAGRGIIEQAIAMDINAEAITEMCVKQWFKNWNPAVKKGGRRFSLLQQLFSLGVNLLSAPAPQLLLCPSQPSHTQHCTTGAIA